MLLLLPHYPERRATIVSSFAAAVCRRRDYNRPTPLAEEIAMNRTAANAIAAHPELST
jgi:hypothetical protein